MGNKKNQNGAEDVKKDLGRYERNKSFLLEIFVFVFIVLVTSTIVIAIYKKSVKNTQPDNQQVQIEQTQEAES